MYFFIQDAIAEKYPWSWVSSNVRASWTLSFRLTSDVERLLIRDGRNRTSTPQEKTCTMRVAWPEYSFHVDFLNTEPFKKKKKKRKNITKQSWNSLRISQLDPLVKQGKRCILDVRHAYWMCRCKLSRGSSFQATGSRLLLPIPNYFTMVQTSIFFLIVFINRVGAAEGYGASTSCAVQSRPVE